MLGWWFALFLKRRVAIAGRKKCIHGYESENVQNTTYKTKIKIFRIFDHEWIWIENNVKLKSDSISSQKW